MRFVLPAVMLCVLSGCSGERPRPVTAAVSGTVKHGGQPVKEGTVIFEDRENGLSASAPLVDGSFQHAAVPVGTLAVFVAPPSAPPSADPGQPNPAPDAKDIPAKFRDPRTSNLSAEVTKDGENKFEFNLDE